MATGWRRPQGNAILRRFRCCSPSLALSDPSAAPNSAADSSDRPVLGAEPIPELVRLGEQLRQARESQGLGIEELAGRLHIGNDQLLALESGDRSHLPEAVFVIAQAKRVASVLGIDVEGTIAQVRQSGLMSSPSRKNAPLPATSSGSSAATGPVPRPPASPARTGRLPLVSLLACLGALAAAFGMVRAVRHASIQTPLPPSPSVPSPPSPATLATPAESVLVLRASESSWLEVRTLAGKQLFEGTLEGEKRFPLGPGLEVMAGRPYAVTARVGDQPPRPLGKVDEIVWRRFLTPKPVAPATQAPATTPPAPAP